MKALNLNWIFLVFILSACGNVEFAKIQDSPAKIAACQGSNTECVTDINGVDYFDYEVTTQAQNFKTDILFVDDNSGSMGPDQAQMASRFPTFLNSISNLDWRIGIVTTDMDGVVKPTQDGKLLQFSGLPDFFITQSMAAADFNNINSSFTNTVKRTEQGAGDERGIYAAIRALQRRADYGFIRNDAHLAVVILSDEDERSTGGTTPAGSQGGPLEAGKDHPQDLIDYVNSTWALEKSLTVHSIIIKPGDTACQDAQKAQANSAAGNIGNTYAALTNLTGGILGTICASDYGAQLSDIADVIQQTTSSITLTCVPVNGSLEVTPSTGWTQVADKIVFNPPLAAGTHVHLKYQCTQK